MVCLPTDNNGLRLKNEDYQHASGKINTPQPTCQSADAVKAIKWQYKAITPIIISPGDQFQLYTQN